MVWHTDFALRIYVIMVSLVNTTKPTWSTIVQAALVFNKVYLKLKSIPFRFFNKMVVSGNLLYKDEFDKFCA
ncbi:hypothetical protein NA23_10730 [Fervidobacterium islandicum]|uniref:Uncharacterized protein n=1 Tax=Fervidobacterium islandicum TaxID=2423 RepID=A0AAJ5HWK8_FERIS|nr:hypothetical protein [Fervidobacterium islandicum]UOE96745.1 hypothetical protein NA23_10730 [Fervidobacterium islandicum]